MKAEMALIICQIWCASAMKGESIKLVFAVAWLLVFFLHLWGQP